MSFGVNPIVNDFDLLKLLFENLMLLCKSSDLSQKNHYCTNER